MRLTAQIRIMLHTPSIHPQNMYSAGIHDLLLQQRLRGHGTNGPRMIFGNNFQETEAETRTLDIFNGSLFQDTSIGKQNNQDRSTAKITLHSSVSGRRTYIFSGKFRIFCGLEQKRLREGNDSSLRQLFCMQEADQYIRSISAG